MYRVSMGSLIRRVARAFFSTVILLFLGLVALSEYDVGPMRAVVVRTGSMMPVLQPGDLVLVDVTEDARENVAVDDVVLFDDPEGRPTIHRVVAASSEGLMTKGDANEDPDPWFVDRVEGVEMVSIPWVGYGLQYLQNGLKVIAMALR
jgi:signal peptidase I